MSHPREPRVLAWAGEAGWALPEHESDEAPAIHQLMRERYGLDVTLLGTVAGHYTDTEQEQAERVLALESHGADATLPSGAHWIGRSELDRLTLAVPEHRPALEQWLREMENGVVPAERAPWARLRWYAMAALWVREQLERLGYREIGPVEQLHARVWSTVLRVPTEAGLVYFKAVAAPLYAFEPDVTRALADLLPANLPRVLAVDEARHWMLLADSGTSLRGALQTSGDTAAYEAMLLHFARLSRRRWRRCARDSRATTSPSRRAPRGAQPRPCDPCGRRLHLLRLGRQLRISPPVLPDDGAALASTRARLG